MSKYGSKWTHDETVIALGLYFQIPFGKINQTTPEVVRIARLMGREPASLSMKMGNIGRLDPTLAQRGVTGLKNGAKMEEEVWNEYVVKTEISRNIIGMIIKVGLVLFHLSLFWFICSLLFDSLLLAIGYVISYVKKIDTVKKWTFDKSLAIYMMKQAFPLLLSGAAIIVYNRIDQVMIGDMIDKSHLGVYSVAIRFTELLVFVPTIIAQTISPMLVEKRKEDLNRYEECSRIFINVTVSLCIMMAVATSLLSYPIVYITFGQAYIGAASVLSILAFKVIGDALSQTSGQLMIVEGIQQYAPIRNLIGCATCIILNLILIKHYGIHGAAYTALITIFVSGTFSNFLIPAYNGIFYKQLRAIFVGWRDIMNIKTILQ